MPSESKPAQLFNRTRVEALLDQGIKDRAYPGAVVMWGTPAAPETAVRGLRGLSRNRCPATENLIYDLASLTKVLATTSLAMIAVARGRLDIKSPLADNNLLPELKGSRWKKITPEHLLAHQSGLPAWRAFHRLPSGDYSRRRDLTLSAISAVEIQVPPGRRTIYSDLNFILLGFLLEKIFSHRIDDLFENEITRPLKLSGLAYHPSSGPLAPTEDGFRWGGPIGERAGGFRGPVPLGRPHDDNAAYLGSAAGHAGLFGRAGAVWSLAAQWPLASEGRGALFSKEVLENFLEVRPTDVDAGRPLGFNLPSRLESLKSSPLSPDSFGHTGYTGPAIWWDRRRNFIWLFLTNRVHPRAGNPHWRPGLYQGGPL